MPPSVLIVDDERDACEGLKLFLELRGFTVRVSYSGEEGVAAVRAAVPDLVLLDLQLTGIDGWQTLQQMRQSAPTVRVVIVTGSVPDRNLEQQVLQAGAVGILTKPIAIDEFPLKIQAFLKGSP